MDQLKPAIDWCKKNIFWIGCFLLSAAMIGTWVMASSSLAEQQTKRESDINRRLGELNRVSGVRAEADLPEIAHPNASTQQGMDAEINKTIGSIVSAWRKNYEEQKQIMTWPADILGKPTSDFFSEIEVPEKVSDPGFEKFRIAYYDRIPLFMDKICKQLGTNWQYDKELIAKRKQDAENKARQFDGMDDDNSTILLDELNRYAVIWSRDNQDLWYQKLTVFQGFDDHIGAQRYPTFMQANMLQQDLWLLEAVFKNIKKLNGKSRSNDTSAIQIIDHIVFGREAINKLGVLSEIDSRLASGGPGTAAGAVADNGMGETGFTPQPPVAVLTEADMLAARSAYHNRYVDPNFESIAAAQVKAVLGGATLPETNLELIVAKRVPFRIALEIDERRINEFIAICANSEFLFEVDQLRVNRHLSFPGQIAFNGGVDKGAGGFTQMGMGDDGMGDDGMGDDGMGGDEMGFSSGGGGGMAPSGKFEPTPVESRTDFMVSVEFYGIVKIYNPVRENFLRLAAGQDVVDETADLTEEVSAAPGEVGPVPVAPDSTPAENPPADGPAQPPVGQPAVDETTPTATP